MTDHLRRELAPISERAWEQIDREAARTFRHFAAARALVDVSGPHGWRHAAQPTGRVHPAVPSPAHGVVADLRGVRPLVELRAPIELALSELDAIDRGAPDPDLSAVIEAAKQVALCEDRAVFHGYDGAGIAGITASSTHAPLPIGQDYDAYPGTIARAVAMLRAAGIGGPYGVALGHRCFTGVIETTEHGGYPVLEHIKVICGGPVIWAPAVDGAVVLSLRGGDFSLVLGQDASIGYRTSSDSAVELYLEESLTFEITESSAAVALVYPA